MEQNKTEATKEIKFSNLCENDMERIYNTCGFSTRYGMDNATIMRGGYDRVVRIDFDNSHKDVFAGYGKMDPSDPSKYVKVLTITYMNDTELKCNMECEDGTRNESYIKIAPIGFMPKLISNQDFSIHLTKHCYYNKSNILTHEDFYSESVAPINPMLSQQKEKTIFYMTNKNMVLYYGPNNGPFSIIMPHHAEIYYRKEGEVDIKYENPDMTLTDVTDFATMKVQVGNNTPKSIMDLFEQEYIAMNSIKKEK